ncbi:surface-adhesin E family protein [Burkholderia ubonensis]|uniref:surface-adhesin E family protein n=1 Tax=Burkholderia ubonensis TaxID=101571 RepID=UPI0039F5A003
MKRIFLALSLACIVNTALASNWTPIGQSKFERVEVERNSMRRDGTHVQVWVREVFVSPRNGPAGKPFDTLMYRQSIDCMHGTTTVSTMTWNLNGNVVESRAQSDSFDIVPDSVSEFVEQAICPTK